MTPPELMQVIQNVASRGFSGQLLMQALGAELKRFTKTMVGMHGDKVTTQTAEEMERVGLTNTFYSTRDGDSMRINHFLAKNSYGAVFAVSAGLNESAVLKVLRNQDFQEEDTATAALALEMFMQSILYCVFHFNSSFVPIPKVYAPVNLQPQSGGPGVYGFVMEELDFNLDRVLLDPAVPEDVVFELLAQVMRALGFLFDTMQFMHNDLRPDNVMVQKNTMQIKLIDFGVACMTLENMRILPEMANRSNPYPYSSLCRRQMAQCDPAQLLGTILGHFNNGSLTGKPRLRNLLRTLFRYAIVQVGFTKAEYGGLKKLWRGTAPAPNWLEYDERSDTFLVRMVKVPYSVNLGIYGEDTRFIFHYCMQIPVMDDKFLPQNILEQLQRA